MSELPEKDISNSKACFIRRISVASNAIETITEMKLNEVYHLIIYCLNCIRLGCRGSSVQSLVPQGYFAYSCEIHIFQFRQSKQKTRRGRQREFKTGYHSREKITRSPHTPGSTAHSRGSKPRILCLRADSSGMEYFSYDRARHDREITCSRLTFKGVRRFVG